MSDEEQNETHALVLPEVSIVMPTGALPVVREGTVGGIPAYEADPPKTVPVMPNVHPTFHSDTETLAETAARMKTPRVGLTSQKKAPAKKKATRR